MSKKFVGVSTQVFTDNRGINIFDKGASEEKKKKNLLLHSCCGPCSTACIERLLPDYRLTVFYYNPCITDRDEYEKRKENQIKVINEFNKDLKDDEMIKLIEGEYLPNDYFERVAGLETEPEGGKRCMACFEMRLEKTADAALRTGNNLFGTTLTVSPHKNFNAISEIGNRIALEKGIEFLDVDFKKRAGFQRSIELSKEMELYRQDYCGCEFSKR